MSKTEKLLIALCLMGLVGILLFSCQYFYHMGARHEHERIYNELRIDSIQEKLKDKHIFKSKR